MSDAHIGQPVDHRDGCVGRELLDIGLGERPDHDRVEVAREDDGRVLDRFAAPELEVTRGEVEPGAPELVDPDLERNPCSSRGLLEDHPECSAGEKVVLLARLLPTLEVVGQVEHLEQLVAAPIRDAGERATFETVRDGDHSSRSYGPIRVPARPASASSSASKLVISVSPPKPSADSIFGRMEPSDSCGSSASASARESSRISS